MDGKTPGLIVGHNFVIDEGEIVGAQYTPASDATLQVSGHSEAVTVYLRSAQSVYERGTLAKKLFERAKRVLLERRARQDKMLASLGVCELANPHNEKSDSFARLATRSDDWRGKCEIGWKSHDSGGRRTEIWVRWTDPTTCLYHWLHPVELRWISEPEQITMPTFADEKEATAALVKAPTPPGFSA